MHSVDEIFKNSGEKDHLFFTDKILSVRFTEKNFFLKHVSEIILITVTFRFKVVF